MRRGPKPKQPHDTGPTSKPQMHDRLSTGAKDVWFEEIERVVAAGINAIIPTCTSNTLLDGNQFDPISDGVVYDVGTNSFSYQGSDSLEMVLIIPADVPEPFEAASNDPDEYLAVGS